MDTTIGQAPSRNDPGRPGDPRTPFRVVVLTCSELGSETADALVDRRGIEVAAVVFAPHRRLSVLKRFRRLLRRRGWPGAAGFLLRRIASRIAGRGNGSDAVQTPGGTPILRFDDFHDAACIDALTRIAPDLGIVDGTYILRETVFDLPRLGSINLHCGKVPEYRGSPPAFWELYHGVSQVGVTIHRVAAQLDAGAILAEESFPLDTVPDGDPIAFVDLYWHTVLRPNGIRMIAETVERLAEGSARETQQPEWHGRPNRSPGHVDIKALRRIVSGRRTHT